MIQGSLLPPYNPFISSIWGEDLISTQRPKNSLCQEKVNCEGSSLTFKVFGQKNDFQRSISSIYGCQSHLAKEIQRNSSRSEKSGIRVFEGMVRTQNFTYTTQKTSNMKVVDLAK